MTKTLSIDIGATGIKAALLNLKGKIVSDHLCEPTPKSGKPKAVITSILKLASRLKSFDRVSVGFPGVVHNRTVITAPMLGTKHWKGYKFADVLQQKLKKPVRLINDADMQGMGAIQGKGLEFVGTLGTGFGSALFRDGKLMPHLELAHHPIAPNGKTYNEYLGDKVRKKIGNKRWNMRVKKVTDILDTLTCFDTIYYGGGNSRLITFKRKKMKIVSNKAGVIGGVALWRRNAI